MAASWAVVGADMMRVLVNAHHALDDIRRAGGIANAPAGHGIVLGESAQQDGALA